MKLGVAMGLALTDSTPDQRAFDLGGAAFWAFRWAAFRAPGGNANEIMEWAKDEGR